MKFFFPVLRADLEMLDTYEYRVEEPLSCPIKVYGGLRDTDAPVESVRACQEHTSARFNLRTFAGDHFFIQSSTTGFVDVFRRDVLSTLPPSGEAG
jgi:medium-chain acyl-[acyl-carrier-protein] hydrolase